MIALRNVSAAADAPRHSSIMIDAYKRRIALPIVGSARRGVLRPGNASALCEFVAKVFESRTAA